jgi:hypothetical protein
VLINYWVLGVGGGDKGGLIASNLSREEHLGRVQIRNQHYKNERTSKTHNHYNNLQSILTAINYLQKILKWQTARLRFVESISYQNKRGWSAKIWKQVLKLLIKIRECFVRANICIWSKLFMICFVQLGFSSFSDWWLE